MCSAFNRASCAYPPHMVSDVPHPVTTTSSPGLKSAFRGRFFFTGSQRNRRPEPLGNYGSRPWSSGDSQKSSSQFRLEYADPQTRIFCQGKRVALEFLEFGCGSLSTSVLGNKNRREGRHFRHHRPFRSPTSLHASTPVPGAPGNLPIHPDLCSAEAWLRGALIGEIGWIRNSWQLAIGFVGGIARRFCWGPSWAGCAPWRHSAALPVAILTWHHPLRRSCALSRVGDRSAGLAGLRAIPGFWIGFTQPSPGIWPAGSLLCGQSSCWRSYFLLPPDVVDGSVASGHYCAMDRDYAARYLFARILLAAAILSERYSTSLAGFATICASTRWRKSPPGTGGVHQRGSGGLASSCQGAIQPIQVHRNGLHVSASGRSADAKIVLPFVIGIPRCGVGACPSASDLAGDPDGRAWQHVPVDFGFSGLHHRQQRCALTGEDLSSGRRGIGIVPVPRRCVDESSLLPRGCALARQSCGPGCWRP